MLMLMLMPMLMLMLMPILMLMLMPCYATAMPCNAMPYHAVLCQCKNDSKRKSKHTRKSNGKSKINGKSSSKCDSKSRITPLQKDPKQRISSYPMIYFL